jgi:hypothetical protein
MAAVPRKRRRGSAAASGGEPKPSRAPAALRRLDEPFGEWRFEPKATLRAVAAMVSLSVGGVALGAGVFGRWLRAEALGASPYAPWLMAAGAMLLAAFFVLGRNLPDVLRIGDLGVGVERSRSQIDRVAWYEVKGLGMAADVLTIDLPSHSLALSLAEHPQAIRRLLAEARERIPERVRVRGQDRRRVGQPAADEGESVDVEPPQVAGLRCMSSGQELTFEHDARSCVRCGAFYHKAAVPPRCRGCGAVLRA